MKLLKRLSVLAVATALPLTADAHRAWMLPSTFTVCCHPN